jgi:hypothetical protein
VSRRHRAREEADYLPGFADALSNVLLALLLLVGVIAMGLVSLNLNIMTTLGKQAEEDAQRILLERRRELALARARGPGTGDSPIEPPPGAITPPPGMVPGAPVRGGGPTQRPEDGIFPFSRGLAGDAMSGGGAKVIQLTRSAAETEQAAARGQAAAAAITGPIRPDAIAQEVVGGAITARIEFDLRDTSWGAGRALPSMGPVRPGEVRTLVTFADLGNRRQMAVAFSRLNSLRNEMVQGGVPAATLKLRILQPPTALEGDPAAISSVYVIDARQP